MRPNQPPHVVPPSAVDDDGVGGSRTLRSVERLRAEPGVRLSFDDWVSLLGVRVEPGLVPERDVAESALDLKELCTLADELRARLHPDGVVTYVIDRNINYTNVCTSICNFCAFYRSPGEDGGYVLSYDDIFRKVEETIELGGSGILMQGGLHPDLPFDWYTNLLRELKSRFPVHLHCFSPTEVLGLCEVTGLEAKEVLQALKEAGLDSMPGGGGEILVDEVRRKRRSKVNSQEWLDISEVAHEVGLRTTATMMFGHGERLSHRLEHLERIREVQDRTGGFVSFILWNFQPDNTPLGQLVSERMGSDEYLFWLAVSRLYLDNIPNLQVSWLTQGIDVGKLGLRSGANDLGSTMIEENVIKPAGANHEATADILRRAILECGFKPCLRNGAYERLETPEDPRAE
ncbi:MAG: dehypoxanthine futalosine cyclase [Planctomycetes bacterium]|nr:dehypoxanthine futalosine cyclase [Planctomycetota bacterium]